MTITDIDVAKARAQTPGCERVLHFNNAGAGLLSRAVIETLTEHLRLESLTGSYEAQVLDRKSVV